MTVSKMFLLAGNAVFTIDTPDDGHRTYRVRRSESKQYGTKLFVSMLTGPNNEEDYTYLGVLDEFTGFVRTTAKSSFPQDAKPVRLLNRVLARVWTNDHAAYEQHGYSTQHEGRCGRCGRTLTVPESVDSGIGPECAEKMGLPWAKKQPKGRKPVKTPAAEPAPTPASGGDVSAPVTWDLSDFPGFSPDLAGLTPHKDREGEITHWDGTVDGRLVTVYND